MRNCSTGRWGWARFVFLAAMAWATLPAFAQPPRNLGACCVVTANGVPVCVQLSAADCTTIGGQFGGMGRSCNGPNACPQGPVGACCVSFGSPAQGGTGVRCLTRDQYQCAVQQGVFAGVGTNCQTTTCAPPPPPTGACCIAGQCQMLTAAACRQQRGQYRGDATSCATTICPGAPTGACCLPLGGGPQGGATRCRPMDRVSCAQSGGTYGGDGTTCATFVCPPPPPVYGACCVAGVCQTLTRADCSRLRGQYMGDNSNCATTVCPGAPTGACCLPLTTPGGTVLRCRVADEVTCRRAGGIYGGHGTTCANYTCPPPPPTTGACCVANAGGGFGCVVVTPALCTAMQGTFGGLGSACAGLPCPPATCFCDWNHDGVIDAADEAAFLADYAVSNADVDGDGDTDQDDLNAFYACYHAGGC